uniref:histidine kinase n=1 Tax=Roseihalotalea indica TaxID=2867963 RepID=A0AA49GPX6_9BACT|nr:sensor histidine kinase [Tunicatimonas sp. TK19036]
MHQGFSICALMILGVLAGCATQRSPQIEEGMLDLRQWAWEKDGSLSLDGAWQFYWGELISPQHSQSDTFVPSFTQVPGTWIQHTNSQGSLPGTGYASYRLQVQLPADSIPLSLRVNTAATAMHIWVNGTSVYQAGQVGTSADQATASFHPAVISLPSSSSLDIVIHISNYHYWKGGLWDTFVLGPSSIIMRHWIRDYAITFFLIGSFIIMALYHLILYFHRRKFASSLYFSIFCLLIVIRALSTELYLIADLLSWAWVIRLELLSFYVCVPVFAAFAYQLYPDVIPRLLVTISTVVTGLVSIKVLILSPRWSSFTVIPFEVFTVGICSVGLYCVLRARWYKLDGILIFLAGFMCVFITVVNDSLYANNFINTFYMTPFGLFFFLFSQSALLSRRFSRLANALERSNTQLERKSQQIEEKNEALIKLNQDLDVFVYRTSHDLRAPLTSLLGIINLIRSEDVSPSIDNYLDLQERSIHKLDSFVREILDYSRNAQLDITPQTIDFRTLIEDTYSLYTHYPQFNDIDKRTSIHQTTPFVGDIKRLEVVFNNLLSNALRYYNPYQTNPFIQIEIQVNETQALLRVQDNGLGIAPEHLDRIFDMFYRASTHLEGSGLGLFLVKETVKKMRGTIQVQSAVNEGTSFFINLPNQSVSSLASVE